MCFRIPKGFKSIAVGKRCATPTDKRKKKSDPEGVTVFGLCLTLSGSGTFSPLLRGRRATLAHGYCLKSLRDDVLKSKLMMTHPSYRTLSSNSSLITHRRGTPIPQYGLSTATIKRFCNGSMLSVIAWYSASPTLRVAHYSLLITGSLRLPTAHCQVLNSAIRNPQFEIPSVSGNLRILFYYEPD